MANIYSWENGKPLLGCFFLSFGGSFGEAAASTGYLTASSTLARLLWLENKRDSFR